MTKRVLAFTFILAFLPFAASAASKNSAHVVLDDTVTVGTTEVPKGEYKVVWTGSDSNAQVTLSKGNWSKTFPAHILEERNPVEAQTTSVKDNKTFLTRIELHDATLVFANSAQAGD